MSNISADQAEKICTLYRNGNSLEKIMELTNVSWTAVRAELAKHDFSDRTIPVKNRPIKERLVAEEYIDDRYLIKATEKVQKPEFEVVEGVRMRDVTFAICGW